MQNFAYETRYEKLLCTRSRITKYVSAKFLMVINFSSVPHPKVCALLWSTEYRELISSHGFARNEVTIWKYPTMTKVAELLGHTERVLYMAMSPDGSVVVSHSIIIPHLPRYSQCRINSKCFIRDTKFLPIHLQGSVTKRPLKIFLRCLLQAVPYKTYCVYVFATSLLKNPNPLYEWETTNLVRLMVWSDLHCNLKCRLKEQQRTPCKVKVRFADYPSVLHSYVAYACGRDTNWIANMNSWWKHATQSPRPHDKFVLRAGYPYYVAVDIVKVILVQRGAHTGKVARICHFSDDFFYFEAVWKRIVSRKIGQNRTRGRCYYWQ